MIIVLSIFGQYEHWPKYAVFIWYVKLLLCQTTKNCIFRHEFYKNCSKSQFHDHMDENLIYVQYVCHLTTFPRDMYIHLHTIGLTGGIRYSYISVCAKSASISLVDFSVDIVASKRYFRLKFPVELKFICAEPQIFSTFSKHAIIILEGIFHGNRSLTSYTHFAN